MNDKRIFPGLAGENAMRYEIAGQRVPSGRTLTLGTAAVRSPSGCLAAEGESGLRLAAGQYLVGFTADAEADGAVGVGLALNGVPVGFAQCLLPGAGARSLSVQAVLPLTGPGTLAPYNNSRGPVVFRHAVLTAVCLGS